MTTFDGTLRIVADIFMQYKAVLSSAPPIYVNRDLNGRVRMIVDESLHDQEKLRTALREIAEKMASRLGAHAYPPEQALLWEVDIQSTVSGDMIFELENNPNVRVVERLAAEANWSTISPVSPSPPRVVFYSIKGGVGRSTALAATAWAIAEKGQRVLVLDLDLESPGLSSSLLPPDRQPTYGIADWLVEDLVDNGDAVVAEMLATSDLSRDGDIAIVPAHGRDPGEYLSKLGRVWMPKIGPGSQREAWPQRVGRLLTRLESEWNPDVVLIDSRSGIDETASVCLTSLGASLILLFALDGDQTWSGYRVIFQHWQKIGAATLIRERLQVVGAMIPEIGASETLGRLRESAWDAFSSELYDEIPATKSDSTGDLWSFDQGDDAGPHAPWPIRWNRGLAYIVNFHDALKKVDPELVVGVFGSLVDAVARAISSEAGSE